MDNLNLIKKNRDEKDLKKLKIYILKKTPKSPPKLCRSTHRYCQFCNMSMPSYKDYEKCNYCDRISGKYKISDLFMKEKFD